MAGPLTQKIQELHDLTKGDGKYRTVRLDRDAYLEENPEARADPRMAAMTGKSLIISFEKNEELEVWELREMCLANPDHPLSAQKLSSVLGLAGNQVIACRADQLASIRAGHASQSFSGHSPPQNIHGQYGDVIKELEEKGKSEMLKGTINTAPETKPIKPKLTAMPLPVDGPLDLSSKGNLPDKGDLPTK